MFEILQTKICFEPLIGGIFLTLCFNLKSDEFIYITSSDWCSTNHIDRGGCPFAIWRKENPRVYEGPWWWN